MGRDLINSMVAIVSAIIGLAIVATLVSRNAQTPALVQNLSSGLGQDITAAEGPVSGFSGGTMNFQFASGGVPG